MLEIPMPEIPMPEIPALEILLPDLTATEALGSRIAAALRPGDAILLHGDLGAGKTSLTRGLLRALCADPQLDVPSPSYTLVQSYETPLCPIHHFDLWRLDGPNALPELGWDDARTDIVIVEWPDRLGAYMPDPHLSITLRYDGDRRIATLTGWDERSL
jgi:tRNA threonylcarbamoyladenosine biosynthesis protein TsaE